MRDHLQALARKGYVDLPNRRGGRVRLREPSAPVKLIPLLGRIVAGVPAITEQNVEGHLPIPADWTRGGQYFALKVDGDSMEGAGIFKGDYVIVRSQQVAAHWRYRCCNRRGRNNTQATRETPQRSFFGSRESKVSGDRN